MMTLASPEPEQPRYTGRQIAMTLIGVVLLLPGLCSLLVMLDIRWDDPTIGLFIGAWVICFMISAVGIALLYLARRGAGMAQ